MSQADDLEERLVNFAVKIIELSSELPKTAAGRHIAAQMLRSGTSPAPNYAEARGAESRADFLHKIRIVFKELNETGVWLKIIGKSEMAGGDDFDAVVKENRELAKIFSATLKTASTKVD